jgi:glutathione S-transferase
MLTIYGVYRSRASRNIWAAHELGVAFKHVPVIQAYRLTDPLADPLNDPLAKGAQINTKSPEFLAVNPNGQIPSVDDDGVVMHQSLAINLYLAKKYGGPLAPTSILEDGQMTMWTLWAATDVEPHSIQVLYHRIGKPPEERDPKIAASAIEALRKPFSVLNTALAATGHIVGNRFTIVDLNVAEVFRYAMPAPELFVEAPHVKAWLDRCHARIAYKTMMAQRETEPV